MVLDLCRMRLTQISPLHKDNKVRVDKLHRRRRPPRLAMAKSSLGVFRYVARNVSRMGFLTLSGILGKIGRISAAC